MKKIFRALSISEAIMQNFVSSDTEPESTAVENKTVENNIPVNNPHQTLKKTSIDETALENLFKNELSQYRQQKNKIIQIVKSEKSRTAINNGISKSFHGADQKNIMKQLKPIIKVLPGK